MREFIVDAKLDGGTLTMVDPSFASKGIKYEGITDKHIDNV